MHGWNTEVEWRRVTTRGPLVAVVIASHVALCVWLLVPRAPPRPRAPRQVSVLTLGSVQVQLLEPPPLPVRHKHLRTQPPRLALPRQPRAKPVPTRHATRRIAATPQVDLLPVPAAGTSAPAFIAGGDLMRRLDAAGKGPARIKLPGGHQYTAQRLQFIPSSQQTLAHKVHMVSDLIGLGWFDPVCLDAQHERAKPRAQQIADGYTPQDLQRLIREHCQ